MLKRKYEWYFWRLNCNKLGAADGITSETAKEWKNNVFTSKQTPDKSPSNIFRVLEVRKKVGLMFWRPKDTMKDKSYVFSGYKQRNKVCLV